MSHPSQLRREFLRHSSLLAGAVALGLRVSGQAGTEPYDAKLTVGVSTGQLVATDFIGLSYENMHWRIPGSSRPPTADSGPVNAVAYAARQPDGKRIVAIINKDATRTVTIKLPRAEVLEVLTAPSLDAKQAQLLDGTEAAVRIAKTMRSAAVPKHTAVLLALSGS